MESLVVDVQPAERVLTDETVHEEFNAVVAQLDETFDRIDPATAEIMNVTAGTKLRGGLDTSQCRDV